MVAHPTHATVPARQHNTGALPNRSPTFPSILCRGMAPTFGSRRTTSTTKHTATTNSSEQTTQSPTSRPLGGIVAGTPSTSRRATGHRRRQHLRVQTSLTRPSTQICSHGIRPTLSTYRQPNSSPTSGEHERGAHLDPVASQPKWPASLLMTQPAPMPFAKSVAALPRPKSHRPLPQPWELAAWLRCENLREGCVD